jgi:hypothetical protein
MIRMSVRSAAALVAAFVFLAPTQACAGVAPMVGATVILLGLLKYGTVALAALGVLIWFGIGAVFGQRHEGRHGVGHEAWHEGFYSKLLQNGTATSCCNLADCTPTTSRQVADAYEVMVEGEWVKVPYDKINKVAAPDGGSHVCFHKPAAGHKAHPGLLLCVVLPPET